MEVQGLFRGISEGLMGFEGVEGDSGVFRGILESFRTFEGFKGIHGG